MRLSVALPEGATVETLLDRLGELEPGIAAGLTSALPVVRGTHAAHEHALSDGDEVALLIPVAGGTAGSPDSPRGEAMASRARRASPREAHPTVFVDTFTNGLLGPEVEMLGPVEDGGHIVVNTTPGCWGPMITPAIRGGHEVAQPVAVAGAEPGDAIAIRIRDIEVTSIATASGNDLSPEGSYNGDPYCAPVCPGCGTEYPGHASRASARRRCAA